MHKQIHRREIVLGTRLSTTACLLMAFGIASMAGCQANHVEANGEKSPTPAKAEAPSTTATTDAPTHSATDHGGASDQGKLDQLRGLVVKLTESTSSARAERGRAGTALTWVYFDAARELEAQIPGQASVVEYIILADFAYSHSDIEGGDAYVGKAVGCCGQHRSSTTTALAEMALGHLNFEHYPKTDVANGREFFEKALATLEASDQPKKYFIEARIHQEWALDEYSVGNEKEGDAQLALAEQALEGHDLPPAYVKRWTDELSTQAIEAKVRGGLL